jgi:hypothetical protein
MEDLKVNAILFLEVKLREKMQITDEDFKEKYGDILKSAYRKQEGQIEDAWVQGYWQGDADTRNDKTDYIDFTHYIQKTYGSI